MTTGEKQYILKRSPIDGEDGRAVYFVLEAEVVGETTMRPIYGGPVLGCVTVTDVSHAWPAVRIRHDAFGPEWELPLDNPNPLKRMR